MKKIRLETSCRKMLADVYTPVGIYLRLRDRFRDTVLLESTDHHAAENSYSFICINAIAGIEITNTNSIEFKLPSQQPERVTIENVSKVPDLLNDFMHRFETASDRKEARFAQGLYGYAAYDAVQFFESIKLKSRNKELQLTFENETLAPIPLMRYRLYQY